MSSTALCRAHKSCKGLLFRKTTLP